MKRTTLIKRVRRAGYRGLPLSSLASTGSAVGAVYSIVNGGLLVTYINPVTGATWVRLPLTSDRGQ